MVGHVVHQMIHLCPHRPKAAEGANHPNGCHQKWPFCLEGPGSDMRGDNDEWMDSLYRLSVEIKHRIVGIWWRRRLQVPRVAEACFGGEGVVSRIDTPRAGITGI